MSQSINIILIDSILALIIIGIFFSLNKFKFTKKFHKIDTIINDKYPMIILFLFLLTAFTSLYKLGVVPYGLHVDEAGMAYDALSLSKYGVDRYLNHFPVYLINYGGGQSAMYAYLVAILIKLFGISIYIIRIPAVALRILTFLSILFIMKDEPKKIKNTTFLFLFSICPYFIMQSRWGLDCNLLVRIFKYFYSIFSKSY